MNAVIIGLAVGVITMIMLFAITAIVHGTVTDALHDLPVCIMPEAER